MKVADIMTRDVVSTRPESPIAEAVRLMLANRISGLPVVTAEGVLVGMVTEADFLRRAETGTQGRARTCEFLLGPGQLAGDYVRTHGRKVSEVMTSDPIAISEDTPLDKVVALMERRQIKRLPVMRAGQVVGIVSRANLVQALASIIRELPEESGEDARIRERLLAELAGQSWAPKHFINVVVRNGIVELWGSIFDERERQALRVAAENISGVTSVEDHLVWIEPMTGMVFESPIQERSTQTPAN